MAESTMRTAKTIFISLSIIFSALCLGLIFTDVAAGSFIEDKSLHIEPAKSVSEHAKLSLEEYNSSLSGLLRDFSSGDGTAFQGGSETSRPLSDISLKDAVLKGTFIGDENAFAIVRIGGEDKVFYEHTELGTSTISHIYKDRILLSSGDELYMHYGAASETEQAAAAPSSSQSFDVKKFDVSKREIMALLDPPDKIMKELMLGPVSRDGAVYGIKIVTLKNNSLMRTQMGLMPGDVLLSMNNKPLLSPEDGLAAYQTMKNEDQVNIKIERGGKPMEIQVSFK